MSKKHKSDLASRSDFGLRSWVMIGGLIGLVMLLLYLAKLKSPQDIRQKAAGSQCYLLIKDKAGGDINVVEGAGGKQQIGGVTYCVGGIGNDADRYASFFESKIAGQTALTQAYHVCQADQLDDYRVGDVCRVGSNQGKVICVGGDKEEYFGCIGQSDQHQFYQRLAQRKIGLTTSPTPSVVSVKVDDQNQPNTKSSSKQDHVTQWQDKLISIRVGFVPKAAFDPTKPEKNQWPWVAVFLNNGADYQGAFDRASCTQSATKSTKHPTIRNLLLARCGKPNLYFDRLVDNQEIKPDDLDSNLVVKTWTVRAGDLFVLARPDTFLPVVKLSLVFYNSYWDGESQARRLGIKFIEFVDEHDRVLARYTPKDKSFWLSTKQRNWSQKHSFYLDLGKVNDQGSQDQYQDGLVYAFDKRELKLAAESVRDDTWWLDDEGSFNLVSLDLWNRLSIR